MPVVMKMATIAASRTGPLVSDRPRGDHGDLARGLARLFRFMMPVTGARPLGSTRIIVGVAAVIRAFIAWDILTRFQTPLVVRMPVGDWLPEPDSLASQLVVGVWLGSAIAFTIGYRVTESGITAPPWRQGPATRPLEGL